MANMSLRRDFQLYIASSDIFEKFVNYGNKFISGFLLFKQDIEYEILLNYTRVLSNIFINTNNKFLCLNETYLKFLTDLKIWVCTNLSKLNTVRSEVKEMNEDLSLVEAMQFTHNCNF